MSFLRRLPERFAAAAAVVLVPLAIRCLPLNRALALCDRWPRVGRERARPPVLAGRARRWLAFGRGPWKSTCLTRSAVTYALLRQHGYEPEFFVGVAGSARRFDAHAWVSVGGHAVDQPEAVAEGYRLLLAHHA